MKNKKFSSKRPPIGVSWGLAVYAGTLILLILLAQIVVIPFTYALVLLCLIMPIPSILLLLTTMPFVSADSGVETATVTRGELGNVCVNIKNRSALPVSTAEVVCQVPDQNGERGVSTLKKRISLIPFGTVTVSTEPMAYRRGRHDVGAKEIWLYDLLHLIKIRKRINGVYTLAVLPKLYDREVGLYDDGSTEEELSVSVDVFSSYDYGDIREYRMGDSMKRIHWKLCAKQDELLVRKNVAQNESYTCIVCDRSIYGSSYRLSDRVKNELDDRTVEEAMLAVSEICRRDGKGCLSVQTDDGGALLLDFGGLGDEAEMRFLLSDLPKGEASDTSALIPENATNVYYILSYLSLDQAKSVFNALRSCVSQSFNVCVRDVSEFIPENKREEYRASLSAFKTLLAENGIQFFSVREGGEKNEEK
ncbi:MAG: DUF58 domain-containing protein [Clostridia bacterium]|nr:DUF58 domain-containing protein [Clostridia bacterium]